MKTRGLPGHHRVQQQVNPTFQVQDERLVTASDRTDPVTDEAVDRTPGHVEGWALIVSPSGSSGTTGSVP